VTLFVLLFSSSERTQDFVPDCPHAFPVRLHLRDAVTLLRSAGYGDPISAEYPDED
jgi:hypothetical protein